MEQPIIEFKSKLNLTKSEKKVLNLLVIAAKGIIPVFLQQENRKYLGSNFYPTDASKDEIEKAAEKNPEILSPFTLVERKDGKLVAIPYHKKYAKLLVPVVQKILEAAKETDNKEFGRRLEFQAKALLEGKYNEAAIYWMSMKPYMINFLIGPIERYEDRLFFTKTSYQAWVGVMDKNDTKRFNKYKPIILSSRRKVMMPSEKVDYYDKVQGRIDDAVIFTGRIARTVPGGINLPNDPNLMEKYGSEITVFKQSNQLRVEKEVLPMFNKIFSADFKKAFTNKDLADGSLYGVILHELAHTYLRYRNSEKNLKDLFPVIDELSASVMGIKVCGSLLLKDIMTTRQLESIMLSFMARSFYLVLEDFKNISRIHYILGGAIFINFLLENGALKEAGGVSWPNFTKMFLSLDELATILERILYQGTREDAQSLIDKYGNIEKLQRFAK